QRGGVEDVADEDVQIAGGVGLMRQPFQLGDDGSGVSAQQGTEYGQGGAQATQAHTQLMQGLGPAHPSQQFGVGRDLTQGGQGRAAQGRFGAQGAGQGIGAGETGRALQPLSQTPAAFGLALEQGDQGD